MGKTTGREPVGSTSPEMLFIGTAHPAPVCHVVIASGQGAMKRGTVLVEDIEGKCVILGTEGYAAPHTASGDAQKEYIAAYILAQDEDGTEEDTVAAAYKGGDFNKGALKVKEGYEMTPGDIAALRNGGIHLGNIMEY